MSYTLNSVEKKNLQEIKNAYYMSPVLGCLDSLLIQEDSSSYIFAFNKVDQVLRDSEDEVK